MSQNTKAITKIDPQRSATMRAVKSSDTGPELVIRSFLHRAGFRFRLHRKDLPGTPDIVFPRLRKLVLVHGCFWHGHSCRRGARVPKQNQEYWISKVKRNKERDADNLAKLQTEGWRTFIVWECHLQTPQLLNNLKTFLEN